MIFYDDWRSVIHLIACERCWIEQLRFHYFDEICIAGQTMICMSCSVVEIGPASGLLPRQYKKISKKNSKWYHRLSTFMKAYIRRTTKRLI